MLLLLFLEFKVKEYISEAVRLRVATAQTAASQDYFKENLTQYIVPSLSSSVHVSIRIPF